MQEDLFTVALSLQTPWAVQRADFQPDTGRIDFHVAAARGIHFTCSSCYGRQVATQRASVSGTDVAPSTLIIVRDVVRLHDRLAWFEPS